METLCCCSAFRASHDMSEHIAWDREEIVALVGGANKLITQSPRRCSFIQEDAPATSSTPLLRDAKAPVVTVKPTSARRLSSGADDEPTKKVAMSVLSIPVLDKMFSDHATRYNSIHTKYLALRQNLHTFKEKYVQETSGVPTIANCVTLLVKQCGGVTLEVRRSTKYSIQLEFNRREVSEVAPDQPENLLRVLDLLNQSNKFINSIITQCSEVGDTAQRSLDRERDFVKDVMKAGLSPTDEVLAMRHCNDNLVALRRIPIYVDVIESETKQLFNQMLSAMTAALRQ